MKLQEIKVIDATLNENEVHRVLKSAKTKYYGQAISYRFLARQPVSI